MFRLLLAPILMLLLAFAPAQAADNPSGLPLPRFATTKSDPINVRVGPGTKYEVAWVYVKSGVPVEIIAEFDTWRKIRDFDGQEGWVHQQLLDGSRAGYVAPWKTGTQISLLARKDDAGGIRAILGAGYRVDIRECDGTWCEVSATDHPETGRGSTYSGFISQALLWGVYQGEEFD